MEGRGGGGGVGGQIGGAEKYSGRSEDLPLIFAQWVERLLPYLVGRHVEALEGLGARLTLRGVYVRADQWRSSIA